MTTEERIAKLENEIAVLKQNIRHAGAASFTDMLKVEIANRAHALVRLREKI